MNSELTSWLDNLIVILLIMALPIFIIFSPVVEIVGFPWFSPQHSITASTSFSLARNSPSSKYFIISQFDETQCGEGEVIPKGAKITISDIDYSLGTVDFGLEVHVVYTAEILGKSYAIDTWKVSEGGDLVQDLRREIDASLCE